MKKVFDFHFPYHPDLNSPDTGNTILYLMAGMTAGANFALAVSRPMIAIVVRTTHRPSARFFFNVLHFLEKEFSFFPSTTLLLFAESPLQMVSLIFTDAQHNIEDLYASQKKD